MQSTLLNDYEFRMHHKDLGAVWKLSTYLLENIPFEKEAISFFCIGTDRSTGDALGPLTGSLLSESILFPFPVIGTLEDPLHALNLQQRLDDTLTINPSTYIVAIDACLGKSDSIGDLLIQSGPLYPGKAVGKDLPPIGDISIKGVVNVAGFMEQAVLQSTRLHLSFEMSRVISRALQLSYSRFQNK
ncbi:MULTISPECIES: spore protease YyaC [Sporosarcina]|uniref:Spore protease YyaC n=1 Tax=Sporosarcina contaminans TaxID=633403 RepID=A0ABW3TVG9_9BACL